MPACVIDGAPRIVEAGLKTWGDLLAALDRECAAAGRGVTAVRFDGVDQPSFRHGQALDRPVAGMRVIDVDTADAATLLAETLDTGRQSVAAIVAHAEVVADNFRHARVVEANVRLSELIEAVRMLVALTTTIASATGIDLATLDEGPRRAAAVLEEVRCSLERLVASQERQQWTETADCVTDTLAPAIEGWSSVFDAIEKRCVR